MKILPYFCIPFYSRTVSFEFFQIGPQPLRTSGPKGRPHRISTVPSAGQKGRKWLPAMAGGAILQEGAGTVAMAGEKMDMPLPHTPLSRTPSPVTAQAKKKGSRGENSAGSF